MMWINKIIAGMLPYMPKGLVWLFSKRYIAGKKIEDAIEISRKLNAEGMMVTIDLLGEFITELKQAEANKNEYLNIIDTIQKAKIDGNYSLKPTMFGLLIDTEVCYTNIREIVAKAASYNNFVRIDMEDSQCVDLEIDLFRRLKAEFPKNVGLVFQAYLKRTLGDLTNLLDIHSKEIPINYRLCKGIYVESEKIAYKKYEEINAHYLEDLGFMFKNGIYPGIATHDKPLIEGAYKLIEKYKVPREMYEFQMLYGVTPQLRKSIVDENHRMRIYVPYGEQWFAYSTRRLKENPSMAKEIIKALFWRK
jgi:proline dehydrogenase